MAINAAFARRPKAGMIVRSRTVVGPDLTLFKLGHRVVRGRRQSDDAVLATPWWFTTGSMEALQRSSGDANDLADTFRRYGAIAKRWEGSGDLVVKATLSVAAVAYVGPGTIQDFRGDASQAAANAWDLPLWCPPPWVAQLYIPMVDASGAAPVSYAARSFTRVFVVPIDRWRPEWVHRDPPPSLAA